MAANEPLTAADLQAGVRVATERGRAAARTSTEEGARHAEAFRLFRQNMARKGRAKVAGDLGAVAGFLTPEALGALGRVMGGDPQAERAIASGMASRAPGAGGIGSSFVRAGQAMGGEHRAALARALGTMAGDPGAATIGLTDVLGAITARRRLGTEETEIEKLRRMNRATGGQYEGLLRR